MAIIENVKEQIEKTRATLDSVQALKADALIWNSFYDNFEYRFCWASNSLEGNTLSLDDTIAVVDYDEVAAGHPFSEFQEAKNLYTAIKEMNPDGLMINEDWIKKLNGIICGTDGGYRTEDVFVGSALEAVFYPPRHAEIPEQMREYMIGLKDTKGMDFEDAVMEAVSQHISFERIHPFKDGNGRTGRIVMNQMLMNAGILPAAIEHTSKYRQAFKAFDRNGDESLMAYLLCDALQYSADSLIRYDEKRRRDQEKGKPARKKPTRER